MARYKSLFLEKKNRAEQAQQSSFVYPSLSLLSGLHPPDYQYNVLPEIVARQSENRGRDSLTRFTPHRGGLTLFTPHRGGLTLFTPHRGSLTLFTPHRGSLTLFTPHKGGLTLFTPHWGA
jgi:hypothetical protein